MKYVIIFALDSDAQQVEVARCEERQGLVVCSGEKALIENLNVFGIGALEKKFFPKDGVKFLEALVQQFDSGYMATSGILEE